MNIKPKQFERAKQLRERGLSYQIIADLIGVNKYTVQRALNPAQREKWAARAKDRRLAKRTIRGDDEPVLQIPDHVRERWLSRAIEYASRTDITSILMNDPLSDVCALYNAERR
jgi:orotate phosphoribosyltransferase-like protein